MKTMNEAVKGKYPYFYDHAQRMLETLRMFVLEAPELVGFENCYNWTTVDVFLTKEDPERLWSMVAAAFSEGGAIREAAAFFKERAIETPDEYTSIQSIAIVLLDENATRWRFHKRQLIFSLSPRNYSHARSDVNP